MWKHALGFKENHKYAELTPDESHSKIRICGLHFEEKCFSSESRLHKFAIPSILLSNNRSKFRFLYKLTLQLQ